MKSLIGILLLLCALTGCGPAGPNYEGSWQHVTRPKWTLDIKRNGENYLINEWTVLCIDVDCRRISTGIADKGTLEIKESFGRTFVIDNATGILYDGNQQFKRVK